MTPVVRSIQSRRAAAARRYRHHVYADARWKACRILVLTRDPVCTICHRAPSSIAHHSPHPLAAILAAGRDPFDTSACVGVCHRCSGRADGSGVRGGIPGARGLRSTPISAVTDFLRGEFLQPWWIQLVPLPWQLHAAKINTTIRAMPMMVGPSESTRSPKLNPSRRRFSLPTKTPYRRGDVARGFKHLPPLFREAFLR
jgi:hypothetical protein